MKAVCPEMIGPVTLEDSLHCAKAGWSRVHDRHCRESMGIGPLRTYGCIPTGVYLTVFAGDSEDFMRTLLNEQTRQIEASTLHLQATSVSGFPKWP